MYKFSRKVNKKRLHREIKRRSVRQCIARHRSLSNENSDDNCNGGNQQQQNIYINKIDSSYDEKNSDNYTLPVPSNVYVENDNERSDDVDDDQWNDDENDHEYEDDSRLLYDGSKITVSNTIRLISKFYLNINLDKQNINSLLRLIESLLPKPNLLPCTWKTMNKKLRNFSPSLTTYLCTNCYETCDINSNNAKFCVNSNCKTSFKQRRSNELIEIVRFDIRSQIQSIMSRNFDFLNKPYLFPTSDIFFAQWYRQRSNVNINKITLLVHTDGAPLVRSSKQSIWPCFASITELPPPIREFQSNIIILALWASTIKPNVNLFLDQTIDDLLFLIKNGTSILINDQEYHIEVGTQLFLSDLPAKSLFCCTASFNGYSACSFCYSRGVWNPKYNKVVYPYSKNDYTARTHEDYLKSAREAVKKSKGRKQVATDGIKGLSCLFKISNYPCQIIFDYMHLVCLCHIPSLIHRWCQRISKSSIQDVDQSLKQLRTPHNIKVVFLESIESVNLWKAKNSRLFVLYAGVPIMTNRLPTLLFSHFIIYSLAIKLLHTPQSEQDILLGERLLHYYCRTIANIYDSSMEIFSLHAHIHLGHQVRLHGGLAHTSAFAFESAIRYIKKTCSW
ncbi:unnamed protein product [Rotaria socialis]|uniref:Transposase n=1 Tax=Rotaria socialis TaxID=392032 RepID=A0A817WPE2_9BILA|nr:unnamed protein product [Rotaria socialis]CAF4456922.1 unnamed protein product [Rotaria socialis]